VVQEPVEIPVAEVSVDQPAQAVLLDIQTLGQAPDGEALFAEHLFLTHQPLQLGDDFAALPAFRLVHFCRRFRRKHVECGPCWRPAPKAEIQGAYHQDEQEECTGKDRIGHGGAGRSQVEELHGIDPDDDDRPDRHADHARAPTALHQIHAPVLQSDVQGHDHQGRIDPDERPQRDAAMGHFRAQKPVRDTAKIPERDKVTGHRGSHVRCVNEQVGPTPPELVFEQRPGQQPEYERGGRDQQVERDLQAPPAPFERYGQQVDRRQAQGEHRSQDGARPVPVVAEQDNRQQRQQRGVAGSEEQIEREHHGRRVLVDRPDYRTGRSGRTNWRRATQREATGQRGNRFRVAESVPLMPCRMSAQGTHGF
jgi:hypothetical protein